MHECLSLCATQSTLQSVGRWQSCAPSDQALHPGRPQEGAPSCLVGPLQNRRCPDLVPPDLLDPLLLLCDCTAPGMILLLWSIVPLTALALLALGRVRTLARPSPGPRHSRTASMLEWMGLSGKRPAPAQTAPVDKLRGYHELARVSARQFPCQVLQPVPATAINCLH